MPKPVAGPDAIGQGCGQTPTGARQTLENAARSTPAAAPIADEVRHRDAGLVRGIGVAGVAANVINIVVGAGVFTLPAAVALNAGRAAPWVFILCAMVMGGVVTCFAAAGSRVPTSGGAYGTVEAALGPAWGFVVGVLLIMSDGLAAGGLAAAVADMLGGRLPALAEGAARLALLAGIFAAMAGANLASVRTTARLVTAATAVKLVPLLVFIGIGLISIHLPAPAGPPQAEPTSASLARAAVLCMFAFEGMESAMITSGEVRDPARTLPRGLFLAMLGLLALYVGVQLSAQHLLGPLLAHSATPLADAAARVSHPAQIMLLGAAGVSMTAWLASDMLCTSRMLFALARDGMLPGVLGRLNRSHIPAHAVCAYAAFGFLLAASGSFLELVALSSLATLCIYTLVCIAALILQRRRVALAGPPLTLRALPLAAGTGLAGMAVILASSQWSEIGGLILSITGSLGLFYAVRRFRRV